MPSADGTVNRFRPAPFSVLAGNGRHSRPSHQENFMRKSTLIAAAVAAFAAAPAMAQSGAAVVATEPGKVIAGETVRLTATITAIDKAKRLVELKGADGETVVVQAGPDVKNFDQIKVGDIVAARVTEAVALQLKKTSGGIRERIEREDAVTAQPGQRPGLAVVRQVTVVADVMSVDAAKQTVRVRGPKRTVTLKVRDPEQFKQIKVGDQIEATFTEAIALAVEPAPKAAAPAAPATPATPPAAPKK
jgi:Cu/Ag efflux protein CusF